MPKLKAHGSLEASSRSAGFGPCAIRSNTVSAIGDSVEDGVVENLAAVLMVSSPRMAGAPMVELPVADIVPVAVSRPPKAAWGVILVDLKATQKARVLTVVPMPPFCWLVQAVVCDGESGDEPGNVKETGLRGRGVEKGSE